MRFNDRIKMTRLQNNIALLDMKLQKPFLTITHDRYHSLCNNMYNYFSDSNRVEDPLLEKLIRNEWILTDEWPNSTLGYTGKIYHITIEPTLHCNLNCPHCLRGADNTENQFISSEEYHSKVMPFIKYLNPLTIGFMGGEPTTCPDIARIIYDTLNNTESRIVLYTNGVSVDNSIIEIMTEYEHRNMIQVSIDGCTPEVHDAIRGSGSFQDTMNFLDILRSYNYHNVLIKMTVIPDNVHEYYMLNNFAMDNGWKLGISMYCRTGRGANTAISYKLMNDLLLNILKDILKVNDAFNIDEYIDSPTYFNRFPCGLAKKGSFTIDPYLNVIDCMNVRRFVGSLNTDEYNVILNNFFRLYFPVVEDIPSCSECRLRYICKGGCRDLAYKHTGSVVGVQPYCKLFKTIYEKYFSC